MNSDSESLQDHLLSWLLADNVNTSESSLGKCEEIDGVDNPFKEATTSKSGEPNLGGTTQTFELGEIPTVQERFQTVLKRRLQIQVEDHPPLFPWESQLTEYPDCVEERSLVLSSARGWMAQRSKLSLPISLPERVFRELLEQCQTLIASSLPLGAKLVQVVEGFFPNESQALNDIAGLVLRSTYRSVDTLMMPIESDYSDLKPRQQMALSLLAAKQLLENLTLSVSPSHPVSESQWLTSAGTLALRVEYQPGDLIQLHVHGELPAKGVLKLRGSGSQATAKSSSPGILSVELHCRQPNPTYTLEVEFPELDQKPLLFVINLSL